MSVLSHTWEQRNRLRPNWVPSIGRPPLAETPARRCEGVVFDRQCSLYAIWLVPEVARCLHHLPYELIPLAQRRAELWVELAAETWAHVVESLPVEWPGE